MKKRIISVAALLCCALMLFTACSAAPGGTASAEPSAPASPVASVSASAEISASAEPSVSAEPIELTLWDVRTEDKNAALINAIIAGFEDKYPNIKVKRSGFKLEDLRNTIKPALNSGEGPDIFSYDAGAGYLGVLAKAGMALDMTSYAQKYDWSSRFYDWALNKAIYDEKLYGVPNELEILGVFYNKEMFNEMGVKPPTTYEEFLAVCKKFKDAGIQPLIMEDKDQWQGFHYETLWLNSFNGPDKVKQAIKGEIPWTTDGFGYALDQLAEIYSNGYTNQKPLSVAYDDANKSFYAGQAPMRVSGTWFLPDFVDNLKDNVGYFFLPMGKEDLKTCPPGGLGDCVVVNAKTKNPDAAMLFVDYMFSVDNMKIWYEAGLLPAVSGVDYSTFNIPGLFKEVIATISNAQDLGENIDVLMSAGINNETKNYMQALIAGKMTGQQCMEAKQKIYLEEVAAGNF